MAQLIETSNYITIKVPLTRGSEETTRSFNLPLPKDDMTEIQSGFDTLIAAFNTGGTYANTINYLFQPTNWRDTDAAEEAWQCADVTKISYEVVNTIRTSGGYGD